MRVPEQVLVPEDGGDGILEPPVPVAMDRGNPVGVRVLVRTVL